MENLTVEFLAKPERLDLFLSKKFPEYSRNFWQNQIKNSQIFINQQLCCENKKKLFGGEIISFADNSNDFANLQSLQKKQRIWRSWIWMIYRKVVVFYEQTLYSQGKKGTCPGGQNVPESAP